MSTRWYYKVGEGEVGPVEPVELERLIKTGRLGPEDSVRDENSDLFRAVRRVPRFVQVLPKTVVKTTLEAAEVEETADQARKKLRSKIRKSKNVAEAADAIARDFDDGKLDEAETEVVPLHRKPAFLVFSGVAAVGLLIGFAYGGYATVRWSANSRAYAMARALIDEAREAAFLGPTSTSFRDVAAAAPGRVAEIASTAHYFPADGPGRFVRRAADAIVPGIRGIQSGMSPSEAFADAERNLVFAKLAFEGRGDEMREF